MGSLSRILSEAYASAKGIFRYKEVLFWVVIFPILLYGLMVGIWGGSNYNPVKLGVYDPDPGVAFENGTVVDLSDVLVNAMNESGLFKIMIFSNEKDVITGVKNGTIDVGLIIPENFTIAIFNMSSPEVKVVSLKTPWADYNRQATLGFLKGFSDNVRIRFINESLKYAVNYVPPDIASFLTRWYEFIMNPMRINETTFTPPLLETSEGLRAFYAIGMIGVEILFIGLSTGASSIIDMKREGTLKIILSSPMRKWELLISETLSVLIAVAISSLSILALSLLLGARYNITLEAGLTIIVLLVFGAIFTIGLGLLLAPLARSPEGAMAIVNLIAFPIMFIGGLVIPKFILPETLQKVAEIYPLSLEIEAIRAMTLYNYKPLQALEMALPSMIATIVIYIIGMMIYTKLLARAAEG